MPWYEKEQPTPFDTRPIEGLTFLSGDLLARLSSQTWLKDKKYPVIHFPSGLRRELWDSSYPGGIVHIFGSLELLRESSRDNAYTDALRFAEESGYLVTKTGDTDLVILSPDTRQGYSLSYDPKTDQLVNIRRIPEGTPELLDSQSRALLPDLYANEKLGLEAVAPVKFFTPSSNWTWYASEFDGDDVFFGLVSGYELELGYFAVSELESIHIPSPLILPIERDLHYRPKTLRELIALHKRGEVG